MSAPLFELGSIGPRGAIVAGILIGIAFGWTLERAGLGNARKLAGQFYLTDLTVFKVMFSAIVTAMLGAYFLGRLGVLDLSRVWVPETFLLPQLAGGLLFGAGFVVAGLCPGTSCVAAATGRGDGALVMLGMFSGVLGTGLAFAPLRHFYESSARGALTLPQLLHVPYGVVVCGVVAIALGAFRVAQTFLSGSTSADKNVGATRALAVVAALGGVLALFAGSPYRPRRNPVGALELAQWIRDRKPGLRIVDPRPVPEFDTLHIPRAEQLPIEPPGPKETIVLVSDDARVFADRDVYLLRGGMAAWLDEVLNPTIAPGAPPDAVAAFRRTSEISRYFGGVPRVTAGKTHVTAATVRRRGC
jgi:rhodanese-related sulfurtransferase